MRLVRQKYYTFKEFSSNFSLNFVKHLTWVKKRFVSLARAIKKEKKDIDTYS